MSVDRHEFRRGEAGYPISLEVCERPPETLYVAGDPSALCGGLAVVGARRATPYGLSCARLFAGWAAEGGSVIISGAAHGCDQTAQLAGLDAGGRSVAVLGCGADVDYPPSSRELLRRLRDGEGAVVSERPWGTEPRRSYFPERNRLIAALSAAVLVVEAGLPSGTFSTAQHALNAGREVWAVPGSVFAPECRGSNRLVADGAVVITDVSTLALALDSAGLRASGRPAAQLVVDSSDAVARALIADPMRPDDVAHQLGLDVVDVARRIARLESAGIVSRYRDGRYGKAEEVGPRRLDLRNAKMERQQRSQENRWQRPGT